MRGRSDQSTMLQPHPGLDAMGAAFCTRSTRNGCTSRQLALIILAAVLLLLSWSHFLFNTQKKNSNLPAQAKGETIKKCQNLQITPGPPHDFSKRIQNDRFEAGTPPTLIRNATIWTGRANGTEVIRGDLLLDQGLIKAIGHIPSSDLLTYGTDLKIYDANGSWLTPGLVDTHSHLGVYSAPLLSGATEDNSYHGPILPWLRSLDALNTHDDAYALSISGGVSTALILPGSVNTIAGQAFPIKLRPTEARSTMSMLLEPPYSINGSTPPPGHPPRWRHMKQACGQNAMYTYNNTRMDNIWGMRQAYEAARQIKEAQDEHCAAVLEGFWEGLRAFPEELQWESLVDVLRGRVKVNVHCYEAVDMGGMILMSQEFKFPIAAFHHAHESYLITEQLKNTFGGAPASAIFSTYARYKRESYRGSEFAPKILHDAGLPIILKSDHPVLKSRDLIFEAQQAYYHGLPEAVALAAVTSTPARVMGLGHRVGVMERGWDADVVVWDSHPLVLGATPKQVFIDGIAQLEKPYLIPKNEEDQRVPEVPNWDIEAQEALEHEGLPPLEPKKWISGTVVFINVTTLYLKGDEGHTIKEMNITSPDHPGTVVVVNGTITCHTPYTCLSSVDPDAEYIDLSGGTVGPGLTSFGSYLGMGEMSEGEISANDGPISLFASSLSPLPELSGGAYALIRAADGLMFGTRDALTAYVRGGVTTGVAVPQSMGFVLGLGAVFDTSAMGKTERGALRSEEGAVHVRVSMGFDVSVSTQIGILRRLLLTKESRGDLDAAFMDIASGKRVLAITVSSADIMASLLMLKSQVEAQTDHVMRMTFVGAQEAHLLAREIGDAGVGVTLVSSRPYPGTWEERRILPGPPLTEKGAVQTLVEAGVIVGLGSTASSHARNIRLDVGWAAIEAGGSILRTQSYALATTNIERLFGVPASRELVATSGGDLLDARARPVACISPVRGVVDVFTS